MTVKRKRFAYFELVFVIFLLYVDYDESKYSNFVRVFSVTLKRTIFTKSVQGSLFHNKGKKFQYDHYDDLHAVLLHFLVLP